MYLVVDDFGRNVWVYRETDVEAADLETVIADLLNGGSCLEGQIEYVLRSRRFAHLIVMERRLTSPPAAHVH